MNIVITAVVLIVSALSYSQTSAFEGGLFLCTNVESGGSENHMEAGEKHFIGVNIYGKRIISLYEGGAGNTKSCQISGTTFVCESVSIGRFAIFDTETLMLTSPFGFTDGYDKSQCEPFTFATNIGD